MIGSDYCIFHAPKEGDDEVRDKDEETQSLAWNIGRLFDSEFLQLLISERGARNFWDFGGFRFPPLSNFSRFEFGVRAYFAGARFGWGSSFEAAHIPANSSFDGAQFGHLVSFEAASIGENTSFADSKFDRDCSFARATIGASTSFRQADIGVECSFSGAFFGARSSFIEAKIRRSCIFADALFDEECSFSAAVIEAETNFQGAHFGAGVSFRGAEIGESCSFMSSTFSAGTSFLSAKLGPKCDMKGLIAPSGIDFSRTTVLDECDFSGSIFSSSALFDRSSIGCRVSFISVEFGPGSSFDESQIGELCDFKKSVFRENCSFRGSTLSDRTAFLGVEIYDGFRFDQLRIIGRIVVDGTASQGAFRGSSWLTDVVFGKDGMLVLRRLNLQFTSFLGTDLSTVLFEDVRWGSLSDSDRWERLTRWPFRKVRDLGRQFLSTSASSVPTEPYHPGRRVLWDELREARADFRWSIDDSPAVLVGESASQARAFYEGLTSNYRQLVRNHEDTRGYEAAEEFYIGEMEMRRKQIAFEREGTWRDWANLYSAYKLLSWYGSSVGRAVEFLAVFAFIVFPLMFMLLGFAVSKDATSDGQRIPEPSLVDWDWCGIPWLLIDCGTEFAVHRWWVDYLAAVRFTFSIISFQRDRFFVPLDGWGQVWLTLAVLMLTGQLALVLFALRRRFKR